MQGRKRTPKHILDLKGTARADRHSNVEPAPLAGIPTCPRDLSKDGKKVWKELVRVMGEAGIFTQADLWAMENFCAAAARCKALEKEINGMSLKRPADRLKQLYVMLRGERNEMNRAGSALGLSPTARASMHIQPASEQSAGVASRDRYDDPPPTLRTPSEGTA